MMALRYGGSQTFQQVTRECCVLRIKLFSTLALRIYLSLGRWPTAMVPPGRMCVTASTGCRMFHVHQRALFAPPCLRQLHATMGMLLVVVTIERRCASLFAPARGRTSFASTGQRGTPSCRQGRLHGTRSRPQTRPNRRPHGRRNGARASFLRPAKPSAKVTMQQ